VRRLPIALALAAAAAGCGGGAPRANRDRPPTPAMLTAAIHDRFIQVSPARIGAGELVLVVSNQSTRPQRVTFESDELGSTSSGQRASTATIPPQGTGRLTIDAGRGGYAVHVDDRAVRAAHVRVGAPRPSAQNQLLLP
jgi:hypothetical protein